MIELSLVYLAQKDDEKKETMWPVLTQAVKHGGEEVQEKLKNDRRLKSIRKDLRFKELLIPQ
jgi:hypothetical protein